jgi:hypothetical protein
MSIAMALVMITKNICAEIAISRKRHAVVARRLTLENRYVMIAFSSWKYAISVRRKSMSIILGRIICPRLVGGPRRDAQIAVARSKKDASTVVWSMRGIAAKKIYVLVAI